MGTELPHTARPDEVETPMTRPTYVPAPVGDDLAAQDAALDVACPRCQATRDTYCVNEKTGLHLHNRVSHWQRVKTAQETPTP